MKPERFKQIRKALNLTQAQMAERIGIKNTRTIRRYEAGDAPIPERVRMILKLKDN